MVDKNGFLTYLYDSSVEFNRIAYEQFEFYRELLGTPVTVTRVTEDKRKKVLSDTLTSTFNDNLKTTKFNWKIIINLSNMLGRFSRNTETETIYDNTNMLSSGDLLEFQYKGVSYQYKVTSTQSYGIGSDFIYQYTIQPIIEHNI